MEKKCTTCKYEPEWSEPRYPNGDRYGDCLWYEQNNTPASSNGHNDLRLGRTGIVSVCYDDYIPLDISCMDCKCWEAKNAK